MVIEQNKYQFLKEYVELSKKKIRSFLGKGKIPEPNAYKTTVERINCVGWECIKFEQL